MGLLLEIDAFMNFNILLAVMIWQNHENGDIWVYSWQMIYVLRYHEDVECVSKEALQEMVRVQPGGSQGSQHYDTGVPQSSWGPFRTFVMMMPRQWQREVCKYGKGGAACGDSTRRSRTSLLETGLSWHRQISQGKFLFLRCNNLTGIDKMKYILESLSTPVRLDHDKNILSYECLNVAAEGLSLPVSTGHGPCYY